MTANPDRIEERLDVIATVSLNFELSENLLQILLIRSYSPKHVYSISKFLYDYLHLFPSTMGIISSCIVMMSSNAVGPYLEEEMSKTFSLFLLTSPICL